jgi:hypothetical protein
MFFADDLNEMRVRMADGYANLEQWNKAVETMELAINALSDTVLRRPLALKEGDWHNGDAAKLALWKQQIAAKNQPGPSYRTQGTRRKRKCEADDGWQF